ncbi:MAG: CDP-glycerol glycerophosphotransferase family protein, partial [Clostridia bacterium]|nr:CDP-glycerol glycerophosphotransferase family protein [Clostridia bacterium]
MKNIFGYFTLGYIKWRTGRIYKWIVFKKIFPSAYKMAMKQPVNNKKVVFVEVRSLVITNSFKVMYDKLKNEYEFDIHTHFLGETRVKKRQYIKNCVNMLKDIATAKYVFLNDASNCIGSIKKLRPETQIIQLWHGCGAFKKFGLSTADLIFGEDRKEKLKYPFYKNNTTVTVSSPEVVWAYEEAMDFENNH